MKTVSPVAMRPLREFGCRTSQVSFTYFLWRELDAHRARIWVWPLLSWALLLCCVWQIDYFNNQIIVDLVEQQHKGIIAILDDACMNVGKVTDAMFLEALNSKLGKHGHFSSRKVTCVLRTPSRIVWQTYVAFCVGLSQPCVHSTQAISIQLRID